ncbi:hypothetical protein DMENIID0001_058030 [Sergentomyia squamirostris]
MSEVKRATLVTIGDGEKVKNKSGNSVRLELKLYEPTADTFPEFNFQSLIHAEKKKRKKISKLNGFAGGAGSPDPFENDDDVARIAKELEKKYGTNSSYGKKHSGRTASSEYCDKGAGYDENDSFIDNTEAYDELIPDEIETVRGGFYINSGPLEFQQLSNYERPEDAQRMPKPKKRVLSSSSSSSDDEHDETTASKAPATQGAGGEVAKNGHHHEKKLKTVSFFDENKIKSSNKVKVPEKKPPADVKAKSVEAEKLVKTTTVKDMLRAKRDNLRMQEASKRDNDTDGVDVSSAPMTSESSNESTALDMPNGGTTVGGVKPEVKLPQQLNEELVRNIILLKEMAKVSASMGKSNFFDTRVQEVLLKVEIATRAAGGHIRNQVYSHLEQHLPCSKQTLMLRAKKMRIQQEETRIHKSATKLRKAVEEIMPGVLENYEKEYEKVAQLKKSMNIMGISEKENELKWPRKQFIWTESTRTLLNAFVNTCRSVFGALKSRKETVEDYVMDHLKTEVLPIWPSGWMKLEGLLKEMEWKIDLKSVKMSKESACSSAIKTDKQITPATSTTASFTGNNSLTITPVSSTAPSSKPLPSVQNKVTITNVDGMVKNPLAIAKTTGSPGLPPQLPSGLSISIAASSSPAVSTAPQSTPPVITSATSLKTASKSPPAEAVPPPKKSFDYSISSIISSASSVLSSPSVTIEAEKVTKSEEKISKPPPPPPEIPSQSINPPVSASSSSATSSILKIRTVESMNSTVSPSAASSPVIAPAKEEKPKKPITTSSTNQPVVYEELSSTTSDSDSPSGSDSSDCEIVENTADRKKKAGIVSKVYMPAPKPNPPPVTSISNPTTVINLTRDKEPPASISGNDNDIDVNQIMKELKELQEFQQVNSRTGSSYSNKKPSEVSEYSSKYRL